MTDRQWRPGANSWRAAFAPAPRTARLDPETLDLWFRARQRSPRRLYFDAKLLEEVVRRAPDFADAYRAQLDLALAENLAARLARSNVTVIAGDVTRLPFPVGRFSAAACLTMLHHIPTPELQDVALAELARVLRPGSVLAGSDGLDTPARLEIHEGDIFVPVDSDTLEARVRAAGFTSARVDLAGDRLKFAATKSP